MITIEIKDYFFDRKLVTNRLGKARAKALGLGGLRIRRSARASIKKPTKRQLAARKKDRFRKAGGRKRKRVNGTVSKPGKPPRFHTDDPHMTIRNILFGHDIKGTSVIVGPIFVRRSHGVVVPAVLEHGGRASIHSREGGRKSITIAPRPFMRPALRKHQDDFPVLFKDSL